MSVYQTVMIEQKQALQTRQHLYTRIEKVINRPVLSFYTSFRHGSSIDDKDAEMIEELLHHMNLKNGLAMLINSPGGMGLASERIIKVCRAYSKTNEFWAIILYRAKSAATMIALGASRLIMSSTSELGPIDPQIQQTVNEHTQLFSLTTIVDAYEQLFEESLRAGNQRIEPYLQQLSHYKLSEIKQYKSFIALGEDIAIKALQSGMLHKESKETIKKRIAEFIDTKKTKSHSRAIGIKAVQEIGLNVQEEELDGPLWKTIYALHVRLNQHVNSHVCKVIETRNTSYTLPT